MRERRWESSVHVSFPEILKIGERLSAQGLRAAVPEKEIICYIEEWTVKAPQEFERLDQWTAEDVTLVHTREGWRGDFYLLASGYHTRYQQLKSVGAYCSVSHPWEPPDRCIAHFPRGMFWVGFRETHAFVRVRLHTTEVVTPGETRDEARRGLWLDERTRLFQSAISRLGLPIEPSVDNGRVVLHSADERAALFCSWPDAFGPCQFEFNTADGIDLLVRSGQLAATVAQEPVTVRTYLTSFSPTALESFQEIGERVRTTYRCSAHCQLSDLPGLLRVIAPDGRLYATLSEFQTSQLLPDGEQAWAIIGIVGAEQAFQIEARFNRAPLPEGEIIGWLEGLLGLPMVYAPLPPFQ